MQKRRNSSVSAMDIYISFALTHSGRVMHICIHNLTIIASDNGFSPGQRQAIIWTNAGILFIRTLGTNFREILSEIHAFSFKEMHLKVSSVKWQPFCLGLNVWSHGNNVHGDITACLLSSIYLTLVLMERNFCSQHYLVAGPLLHADVMIKNQLENVV